MSVQPLSDSAASLLREIERGAMVSGLNNRGGRVFLHRGIDYTTEAVELRDAKLVEFAQKNEIGDVELVLATSEGELDEWLGVAEFRAEGGAR